MMNLRFARVLKPSGYSAPRGKESAAERKRDGEMYAGVPRMLFVAGLIVCVATLAACRKASDARGATPGQELEPSRGALAGAWRWVASKEDGQVVRPVAAAESTVIALRPYGGYQEHTGESTLRGHYYFARGRMYALRDSSFVVLLLDSSRFFPRSNARPPAVAVRSLRSDTLTLSGTGADATLYTFVRVDLPPDGR